LEGVDWRKEIGQRGLARRLLEFARGQDLANLRQALDELRARNENCSPLLTSVFFYLMEDRVAEAARRSRSTSGLTGESSSPNYPEASARTTLREGIDPEQVIVLNDLSRGELDRVLDPIQFQDRMQFLEREQKKIVEEDCDRPIVLRGVSGKWQDRRGGAPCLPLGPGQPQSHGF